MRDSASWQRGTQNTVAEAPILFEEQKEGREMGIKSLRIRGSSPCRAVRAGRGRRISFWVRLVITTIDVAICEDSGAERSERPATTLE